MSCKIAPDNIDTEELSMSLMRVTLNIFTVKSFLSIIKDTITIIDANIAFFQEK